MTASSVPVVVAVSAASDIKVVAVSAARDITVRVLGIPGPAGQDGGGSGASGVAVKTTGGPVDYIATAGLSEYPDFAGIDIQFNAICDNDPTIELDGLGALPLFFADGTTPLTAGSVIAGPAYHFIIDATLDGGNGGVKAAATV